jgi:hypothetical protein
LNDSFLSSSPRGGIGQTLFPRDLVQWCEKYENDGQNKFLLQKKNNFF